MEPALYHPRDFLWSQRDPRWREKLLGQSELHCGGYGCATLCVCYVVDRRRKDIGWNFLYPDQVIDRASYDPGGKIYWNTADRLSNGRAIHTYDRTQAHYTLMQVEWGTYLHWVVLLDGDLCYDPWDGTIKKRVQVKWKPSGRYIYYKQV